MAKTSGSFQSGAREYPKGLSPLPALSLLLISNHGGDINIPYSISYFLGWYVKVPEKGNLRKGGFLFLHSLQVQSIMVGRKDGRSMRSHCLRNQEAETTCFQSSLKNLKGVELDAI